MTRRCLHSHLKGAFILFAAAMVWPACGGGIIHGGGDPDAASADAAPTDAAPTVDAIGPLSDAATQPDAAPNDGGCQPTDCAALGHECGQWDNGCNATLDCGDCDTGETCENGTCEATVVDCSGIANHPTFELCDSGPNFCAGVFTNGEGCTAFCAAAGLLCSARYGGEPGCQQEPQTVLSCGDNNGHLSDWCECQGTNPNPNCSPDPLNPPTYQEQHYTLATYFNRSAWVLTCYDYAYTANRNPAGALVEVTSAGQTYTAYIMQRDSSGTVQLDLHGRYCLDGTVTVVMDSTMSGASDSIRSVVLTPVP